MASKDSPILSGTDGEAKERCDNCGASPKGQRLAIWGGQALCGECLYQAVIVHRDTLTEKKTENGG